MTPKERIYATLAGKGVDRPAVTPIFMAWAAHHVGHTYRDYYLDAAVLAKAQLAVARDFNIDQVSAISDPFRETSAYGVEFDWPEEGVGKAKELLINSPADISRVAPIDIENSVRTRDRLEGVKKLAAEVGQTHSVLGWVEGPIAEYGDLRGVQDTLMDLIDRPDMFAEACEIIVDNAVNFARAQIKAGADMIGVGDAAASLISPEMWPEFVLPFWNQIYEAFTDDSRSLHCENLTEGHLPLLNKLSLSFFDPSHSPLLRPWMLKKHLQMPWQWRYATSERCISPGCSGANNREGK